MNPSRPSVERTPTDTPGGENGGARGKRTKVLGTRLVISAFITVACVFIGLSTLQIVPAVFGMGIEPLSSSPAAGPASGGCADGLRALDAALDRAASVAVAVPDPHEEAAVSSFNAALLPEWNAAAVASTEARCAREPRGREAFAALLRLRSAREQAVGKQAAEIAPLRRNVAGYLGR